MKNLFGLDAPKARAFWPLLGLVILLILCGNAWAVTRILDGTAAAPNAVAITTDHQIGSGAWQNVNGGSKFEMYLGGTQLFPGPAVTVSQIAGIEYWTRNGSIANPQGLDFFFLLYTAGTAHGWYGERLTSEPMYYNSLNRSTTDWNHWNTAAGANQMTWFDANHSAQGYANAPTLADIQAGSIDWSAYPGGSGVVDYRAMEILSFSIQTGSGWDASFDGLIDHITITLTDGRVMILDLEQSAGPVHNLTQNASYTTIDAAVANAASGDQIAVDAGTYPTGIVSISRNISIGASNTATPPTITPTANTGSAGDARGWFLVQEGINADFQYLAFDGSGRNIFAAIRHKGTGTIDHCQFSHMMFSPYMGFGIMSFGAYPITVQNCTFSDIERVGTHFFSATTTPRVYRGNTHTGKGTGDFVNYGLELGGGATGLVENNTITACLGVAYDGSTSAAVLATDYWGPGTAGTLTGNEFTGNTSGLDIGYSTTDATVITMTGNTLGGSEYGVYHVGTVLAQVTANWWGAATGPDLGSLLAATASPQPFDPNGNAASARVARRAVDAAQVHGLLHYSPWTTSGLDANSGLAGWQPNLSTLGVSTNGTIQEGIDLCDAGGTVNVMAGTYTAAEQILINKSLTLHGAGNAATIILPGFNTSTGGNVPSEALVYVAPGFTVAINDLRVDGTGYVVHHGIQSRGTSVTVENCDIRNINAGNIYLGRGIVFFAGAGQVNYCTMSNIQRIGVHVRGNVMTPNPVVTVTGLTYVGKGVGDFLDYGVEFGGGGSGSVVSSTISNCRGLASIDGSESAAILATDYWGTGTSATVTGCTLTNSTDGIAVGYAGADVTPLAVHESTFSGNGLNVKNVGSTSVDATCNWWGSLNYASILGKVTGPANFTPWTDVDFTPCTYTNDNTFDFTLSFDDAYVGCAAACANAMLKVAYDRANYVTGHMIITLPAGIVANWTGNQYQVMPPAANRSTNLNFINAAGGGTGTITLDVSWIPPYSMGVPGQYIAWLPVRDAGAFNTAGSVTASGLRFIDAAQVEHTNDFDLVLPDIYGDCAAPAVTLNAGTGEGACAGYNDAAAFAGALTFSIDNGTTPPASALVSAVITNGTFSYNVPLTGGTWPTAEASTVFANMTEGCNVFSLTVTDAACNPVTTADVSVIKDTQAPEFTGTYFTTAAPAYNNVAGDANHGAARLNSELHMSVAAAGPCQTGGFTLSFTMGSTTITPITGGAVADYPTEGQATDLWNLVVANTGSAFAGPVTVPWTLSDCLGNTATGSFTFNVDFAPPTNSFSVFDARPTSDGVWLKWALGSTDAVEAKIFRKGEDTYPVYSANLWNSDINYTKTYADAAANWQLVATLPGGVSSTDFHGGADIHAPGHADYWKDASAGARDIYRYVTFVKDASGNWSQLLSTYTIGANADRSTNYWLGDFAAGGSAGIVNTADLTLLSEHYFQAVEEGFNSLDIGPEVGFTPANAAQGMGKNIPDPDQTINFDDLVPFSFNFGLAGIGGYLIQPNQPKPFDALDGAPVVVAEQTSTDEVTLGSNFTVVFSLAGNDHAVKAIEAELKFDPEVVELVSINPGSFEVSNGIPWSTAKAVTGEAGRAVMAAAAMGETASLNGDGALATATFRWKSKRAATTSLELVSVKMSDGTGARVEGTGARLAINASGILPTSYALFQNYPNPFNPTTSINFDLKDGGFVSLKVYNLLGQNVATLVNNNMEAGHHSISFDANSLSSGMYIYKIEVNGFTALHKMMLMR